MSDIILTAYNGRILGPIAKILGFVMDIIYRGMEAIGIENIGLCIILLTIVIYLCMFPVTYKQQKFSKLSMQMQPEIQAVQKKYKDKKDQASMAAMQEETQLIYQKYGVSPTGSCAYMLISMPILFALYRVIYNVPAYVGSVKDHFQELADGIMGISGYQDTMTNFVADMKVAGLATDFTATDKTVLNNYIIDVLNKMSSTGWDSLKDSFSGLTDLITKTQMSVTHINQFFGMNISDSPWNIMKTNFEAHNYILIIAALLIPICSYLTQVLNIKLMPQAANGNGENDQMANQMKMMNNFMPLMSLFMCFTVPVGLGIYWIAGALIRSIQQFILNKHFEKIDLNDIIAANQEKAKKKREKMGISENQINNAARMNTRKLEEAKSTIASKEKEELLEKAASSRSSAKAGSMASKANMVKEFNERNSR